MRARGDVPAHSASRQLLHDGYCRGPSHGNHCATWPEALSLLKSYIFPIEPDVKAISGAIAPVIEIDRMQKPYHFGIGPTGGQSSKPMKDIDR